MRLIPSFSTSSFSHSEAHAGSPARWMHSEPLCLRMKGGRATWSPELPQRMFLAIFSLNLSPRQERLIYGHKTSFSKPLVIRCCISFGDFPDTQILHGKMQFVGINIRDKNGNYPLSQIGFIQQSQGEMAL